MKTTDSTLFKRTVAVYTSIISMLLVCVYSIITANNSFVSLAGISNSTRKITVTKQRADIFDCNGERLTGDKTEYYITVKPNTAAVDKLKNALDERVFGGIADSLGSGYPVCVKVPYKIFADGIDSFDVPVRYGYTASHIIGYTDGENGVSGIEKSYNGFLKQNGSEISVKYSIDASGRTIGSEKSITDTTGGDSGVYLTIDKSIQKSTEYAMDAKGIESGAAVVMDAKTGEIKAIVSRPDYKPESVADYLDSDNSPLMNKALCAYAVGSVFKPFVAATGIESGISTNISFQCDGEFAVNDKIYTCSANAKHGLLSLTQALAKSCNIYFIRYAQLLEKSSLLNICEGFGFGKSIKLADDIISDSGVIPQLQDIENPGDYANFSFGQGKFSVTPVQLAAAYCALVTDGIYKNPVLVKGTLSRDGAFSETAAQPSKRVISEKTAKKIRRMLEGTVNNQCISAKPFFTTAGGKTGTAQSGIYTDGTEICRTWFAGFFPADEPEYVAVILKEDGTSGSKDCAPVFRLLADEIMKND